MKTLCFMLLGQLLTELLYMMCYSFIHARLSLFAAIAELVDNAVDEV